MDRCLFVMGLASESFLDRLSVAVFSDAGSVGSGSRRAVPLVHYLHAVLSGNGYMPATFGNWRLVGRAPSPCAHCAVRTAVLVGVPPDMEHDSMVAAGGGAMAGII